MDAGPVTALPRAGSGWRLRAPHDARTQGLVVSGFGSLETGRALLLQFTWPEGRAEGGGAWLRALQEVAPITAADGGKDRAAALGLSYTGLVRMGLDATSLASFSRPFREGMYQEDRLRRLGDRRNGAWLETVIKDGPQWSANTPRPDAPAEDRSCDLHGDPPAQEHVATPVTVHALLLLYTLGETEVEEWRAAVETTLSNYDVTVVHRLPLVLDVEQQGISREHFGFADGLSQPVPFDDEAVSDRAGRQMTRDTRDLCNGVPLGEILIGHMNGHNEVSPGPIAPSADKRAEKAGLPPHEQAQGLFDLGLDGSYMVVRELKQDVAAFWRSMRDNAEHIRLRDPRHSANVTADWLAERVVGRNRDGHLLCPGGYLDPDENGMPNSSYGFFDRDRHALGCPAGSHVRRANPRDSLAPDASQKETLLEAANRHRILRRGRKYGPRLDPALVQAGENDQADRGLLFICLNTDIARQFEFVQQTWLLNPNFATLFDEVDPLVGPAGRMTVREAPLRRILNVETFVQMVGGDYFFLPSLPALSYLALL